MFDFVEHEMWGTGLQNTAVCCNRSCRKIWLFSYVYILLSWNFKILITSLTCYIAYINTWWMLAKSESGI